ncbi:MAG: hypothetical protein ABW022_01815 [Actinoplanes sp.]
MAGPGTERTGILILRAWVEEDSAERLRVRITDATSGLEIRVTTTTAVDGACEAVRAWLETVQRPPD